MSQGKNNILQNYSLKIEIKLYLSIFPFVVWMSFLLFGTFTYVFRRPTEAWMNNMEKEFSRWKIQSRCKKYSLPNWNEKEEKEEVVFNVVVVMLFKTWKQHI